MKAQSTESCVALEGHLPVLSQSVAWRELAGCGSDVAMLWRNAAWPPQWAARRHELLLYNDNVGVLSSWSINLSKATQALLVARQYITSNKASSN